MAHSVKRSLEKDLTTQGHDPLKIKDCRCCFGHFDSITVIIMEDTASDKKIDIFMEDTASDKKIDIFMVIPATDK